MTTLDIYIDGASKGNPGPSGIGIIIMQNGSVIRQIGRFIGPATNNVAEYTALIHGLQEGLLLKADTVRIKSDSELLCRQMNKAYKVRNANIIGLYAQAERLLSGFREVSIDHIPREQNAHADRLATQAVKDALKR